LKREVLPAELSDAPGVDFGLDIAVTAGEGLVVDPHSATSFDVSRALTTRSTFCQSLV
jgi:threonine synthase